jgi:MoaA/NifB/PqqE/SkfB family radical SAM enzyme
MLHRLIAWASKNFVPLDVSLELTHRCNFRCQHCYIPDFSLPNLLTTERILSLLEELKAAGTLFLTLTGGEMFLRQDWFTIAQRARE